MKRSVTDRSIEDTLKSIDKLSINPDELAYWTTTIESVAKNSCKDESDNITFVYCPVEKVMQFSVKDYKSKDCLVKSIEQHLPIMPELLRGFFKIFNYNLKNLKFHD